MFIKKLHFLGGIPCRNMGPINEWWTAGFDGGENALVGFSTAYADYFLMAPSEAYAPFIDVVKEKIHMAKVLIEFLQNNQDATYEDLLNKIQVALCYGKKEMFYLTIHSTNINYSYMVVVMVKDNERGNPPTPLLFLNSRKGSFI